MALQRGPPMPKSRGLVSLHSDSASTMTQTRSGRHSYRPVDYWRGEEVVVGEEEFDDTAQDFVLPTIKEIVRVPQDILPSKRAPGSKTRAKSKSARAGSATPSRPRKAQVVEEDEELEEWELDPGTMRGDIVMWEPDHEIVPPTEDDLVKYSRRADCHLGRRNSDERRSRLDVPVRQNAYHAVYGCWCCGLAPRIREAA